MLTRDFSATLTPAVASLTALGVYGPINGVTFPSKSLGVAVGNGVYSFTAAGGPYYGPEILVSVDGVSWMGATGENPPATALAAIASNPACAPRPAPM